MRSTKKGNGEKMSETTLRAIGELVQAAAHQHGVVGPVQFTVCRPRDYSWCTAQDDYAEVTEEEFENGRDL